MSSGEAQIPFNGGILEGDYDTVKALQCFIIDKEFTTDPPQRDGFYAWCELGKNEPNMTLAKVYRIGFETYVEFGGYNEPARLVDVANRLWLRVM